MSVFVFTLDPAGFVSASFERANRALAIDPWAALGPFVACIAVLVELGVVWLVTTYLDRQDSGVPGTGLDLFGVGNDADGQED